MSPTPRPLYETLGHGYAQVRRPDPRIAAQIHAAIGDSVTILNVGAGAGSYEPADRDVVALEPSRRMIDQRPAIASTRVVQADACAIPFEDGSFDGTLALLTVHHWANAEAGLLEVRRVTKGRIVVLTFDHAVHGAQWLVRDYLPMMMELDAAVPSPEMIARMLGGGDVRTVSVPRDCTDGFCHAYWQRPSAYLEPGVRAGISGIARLPETVVAKAMGQLAHDLESGVWRERNQDFLDLDEVDAGYRLVVAGKG